MGTPVNVKLYGGFKPIADYDDTNGNDVTNNTGVDIYVGLTGTDGVTEDAQYKTLVVKEKTVSFADGLGAGRKIIVYSQNVGSLLRTEEIYVG
jgi:hypothetical protein